ncbi:alpha/beta hydrolase [Caulobacter sp. 73W]|uniref:Alpha/beta hydrolase n=1 Tax=Caulobacter sp. 73W TaxID=3161137 RepID=A0AB39KW37_9CAUL
MSILGRLFGEKEEHVPGTAAAPDGDMQKVLAALAELKPIPFETLTPEEARRQPTPADAVMTILRKRGMENMALMGVQTEDITIPGAAGPLEARIYRPDTRHPVHPVVIYWHGGGWVFADINVYDSAPRGIARFADCIVVSCHYRQAPENKFPAAHEDALAAYRWVLENAQSFGGDPTRIAVMGESAGGNLACATAIAARDQGLRQPCHMALIYPVAGADMNTPSYRENVNAKPLNKAGMEWFVKHVFNSPEEAKDPRVNLVEADLHDLPSATIITAEIDPLCSEGELLGDRLEQAGVDLRRKTFHGVTHEFFGMGLVVKDAAAAEAFVAHELKRAFGTAMLPI